MTIEQLSLIKCYSNGNTIDTAGILPALKDALPLAEGDIRDDIEQVIQRLERMTPEEIAELDLSAVPSGDPAGNR